MRTSTSQASERPGPRPAVGIQAYRMCLRGQSVELVTERSNGPDRLIDLNARRGGRGSKRALASWSTRIQRKVIRSTNVVSTRRPSRKLCSAVSAAVILKPSPPSSELTVITADLSCSERAHYCNYPQTNPPTSPPNQRVITSGLGGDSQTTHDRQIPRIRQCLHGRSVGSVSRSKALLQNQFANVCSSPANNAHWGRKR